ncbi:MAG TPA: hypothetical protein VK826_18970 [Bacteroidia bacterium]|nr:hypothetical protein [Bacteroidia bacterium]
MSKEFSTQITCHCERSNPIFKVGIASFLAMTRSVCVVLILMSADLAAQTSTHDSIYNSLHGRISLGGGFDSRNSFISNRRAHIWGIKVAAEFGELIQLGIGYNRLDDDLTRSIYFTNTTGESDSATGELRMDYWSWYARYVFYRKGRWKFSVIPFQLGIGRSRYVHEENEEKVFTNKKMIIVYETGFSVSFRIFRWLGVGSDVGVRWMVKDNPAIPEKFNSPQYAFYGIIYWTEILRIVAPKNKFVKRL